MQGGNYYTTPCRGGKFAGEALFIGEKRERPILKTKLKALASTRAETCGALRPAAKPFTHVDIG
jgi:hypothetical protein